ncbi:MAG: acetyl esterase [Hyphomicrobiaceae bacterium]|jgi:acetyl esterase/lipase
MAPMDLKFCVKPRSLGQSDCGIVGAMIRCLPMILALATSPMVFAQADAPMPTASKPVAAELQTKAGVVYKTVGDVELRLYLFFPKDHVATDTRPAAVFYFGGGWNGGTIEQFKPQAHYLASRGMVTAVCDYRVKQRHGTDPFACVADGKSAVRWLRSNAQRLGIDPKRIAAGGGSAGGHVAATTGVVPGLEEQGEDTTVSSKANALLLFNPVFDNGPGGYGHARVKKRYREISPLHNISKDAPPTIVFLGTKDKHIPVATAESYADKMKAAGSRCDLHLYKGLPHGFFNQRNKKHYYLTVLAMDQFLISLGWLQGEPTIKKPAAGK